MRPGSGGTRWRWAHGRPTAAASACVALLLAWPSAVPNTPGRLGSLLETFLPWLGLATPVLLGLALLRRSATALLAAVLAVAVWLAVFGRLLLPAGGDGGRYELTAVQHNVSDENSDPRGAARALRSAGPQLVALEEVTPAARPVYEAELGPDLPHHAVIGTVGLWSAYELTDVRPLDIKPDGIGDGWQRGLRATARTPRGDVAVFVAHLPSVRVGLGDGFASAWRDESAVLLAEAVAAERLDRVILLGDLNGTLDDRGLGPVLAETAAPATGFALSWPAGFPVARIDQVLARSATVAEVWTLPATGSDHLPVAARVRL
ncbi:endonuclease/exonuclease/phosphatase family protein [Streptomyces sp. HNM0663]|uniref:Endonuclease/exonuclease/phosphatase family protein n=1 Tax=Streptomyces chengmaiensis TaxID=3040919 RepID=A0ABT6HWU1_9ACTN|nr:endonuclease/exonuclease/phosphatase family protein [Streptomyces chengmaiensis]MDH2392529.1 endonuclease/exonuclease/phosphatase family protein [Streptomyces chengmaiensis]